MITTDRSSPSVMNFSAVSHELIAAGQSHRWSGNRSTGVVAIFQATALRRRTRVPGR